jgi:NitT/TauT family transport system substrate-binding protein
LLRFAAVTSHRHRSRLLFASSLLVTVLGARAAFPAEEVVVAVLPLVSSAPVFLAQSRGFFAAEGLDVELRFFQAAQPVAVAVASGDVELGVTGFIAYVAGAKAWQAGLRSLDGLTGRSIGITQTGSTFHYMVGRLAEKRGFALETVKLVTLETVPNVIAALRGGRIDAALLPGHQARPLIDEGIAKLLGWAGDETPWQLGAVFTTPRVLERRARTVDAFLRAYRRAAAVYDDALRPVRSGADASAATKEAARAVAEELRQFVPATIEEILASAPRIDREGRLEVADVREQVAWYQRHRMVDRAVRVDDFLAPQARDLARP